MTSIDDKCRKIEQNLANHGLEAHVSVAKTLILRRRYLKVIITHQYENDSHNNNEDAGIVLRVLDRIVGRGKSKIIPTNKPGIHRPDYVEIQYKPFDKSVYDEGIPLRKKYKVCETNSKVLELYAYGKKNKK